MTPRKKPTESNLEQMLQQANAAMRASRSANENATVAQTEEQAAIQKISLNLQERVAKAAKFIHTKERIALNDETEFLPLVVETLKAMSPKNSLEIKYSENGSIAEISPKDAVKLDLTLLGCSHDSIGNNVIITEDNAEAFMRQYMVNAHNDTKQAGKNLKELEQRDFTAMATELAKSAPETKAATKKSR